MVGIFYPRLKLGICDPIFSGEFLTRYWMCQPSEVAGFEHEGIRVAKGRWYLQLLTPKNISPPCDFPSPYPRIASPECVFSRRWCWGSRMSWYHSCWCSTLLHGPGCSNYLRRILMILILIKMNDVITISHVFIGIFHVFLVLFKRSPKIPKLQNCPGGKWCFGPWAARTCRLIQGGFLPSKLRTLVLKNASRQGYNDANCVCVGFGCIDYILYIYIFLYNLVEGWIMSLCQYASWSWGLPPHKMMV